MNTQKIGKFIAKCRKSKNLTQEALAEKLNITSRAISKWETGNGLPDSSIMLELCSILAINVNELLSGEKISMQEYQNKAEANLLELQKENEEQTKRLLMLETVIGLLVTISFLTLIFVASLITMPTMVRILLIVIGLVIFIIGISYCLLIEQKAGYYECTKCHYRYIPTYKQVLWAMHTGRSRYMKCPKCGSRSWHKKVLTK